MAYRLLLFGENSSVIEDMYTHSNVNVELMTTSTRYDDMVIHTKYYKPNALVYCMGDNEPVGVYKIITTLKKEQLRLSVPLITIASSIVSDEFKRACPNLAELMLVRPITGRQIIADIVKYLVSLEKQEEEPPVPPEDELVIDTEPETQKPIEEAPVVPTVVEKPSSSADTSSDQALLDKLTKELLLDSTQKRILVVDDDPRMLKVIKRHLDDRYDVATAVNGKVALKYLQTKTADLILLDYEMPIQNGPEVLSELRANPKTENIPVVFLTGINDREKIRTALSMRPQGYLLKPIERIKLLETIRGILG